MSAPFTPSQPGRLRIISADERMAERRGVKGVLAGASGIGKTSQLWSLDPATTLFLNLEAGELAVQGWPGDEVRVRDWELARDIACWLGGPNPAMRDEQFYSAVHYTRVCETFGSPAQLAKYETIFVDSITVASRLCLQWCKGQPQSMSDRSGRADLRGAYGLLGQEMIGWVTHFQHVPDRNVWLVGILDRKTDDFGRTVFALQVEGTKTGLELPGVIDELITLAELRTEKGEPYRAFICTTLNPFGFPAKDRSGRLATIEGPHLGRLMEKIRRPTAAHPTANFQIALPAAEPAAPIPTTTTTQER